MADIQDPNFVAGTNTTIPTNEPPTKQKKKKKKGGAGVKFLCVFLGFLLGILTVLGAVAGAAYFVATKPVDETVNTVDSLTGAGLYEVLFGSTDENGEETAGLLNKKYAEMKIGEMLGDIGGTIGNLSGEDANLAALNEISPKVGETVDNLVGVLEGYGIPMSTEGILYTPIKGDNGLLAYLQSSLKDAAAGDLLTAFTGETLSPLFLSICYGRENVDYVINDDGEVEMINGAKKTTIGELTETEMSALFGDILLVDVIGLESSYDSKIVMRLLFGKENEQYKKVDTNGDGVKDDVEMLRKVFYYAKNDPTQIYDDSEKLISGVSVNVDAKIYTDADGKEYSYTRKGSKTLANGVSVQICNFTDLYYTPTSIADLMGEENTIEKLVNTITIGEVFDDDMLDGNIFLKHVKNETIESLPDKIATLKVAEVYKDEVYKADGVTLKGSWKYLLTNPATGKVDDSITITDMQKMIDNMQANIHNASLKDLKKDGILSNLSDDMLTTKIRTSIMGQGIGISFPGKTTLGDLTVDEMLQYVDALLGKLPD